MRLISSLFIAAAILFFFGIVFCVGDYLGAEIYLYVFVLSKNEFFSLIWNDIVYAIRTGHSTT